MLEYVEPFYYVQTIVILVCKKLAKTHLKKKNYPQIIDLQIIYVTI